MVSGRCARNFLRLWAFAGTSRSHSVLPTTGVDPLVLALVAANSPPSAILPTPPAAAAAAPVPVLIVHCILPVIALFFALCANQGSLISARKPKPNRNMICTQA